VLLAVSPVPASVTVNYDLGTTNLTTALTGYGTYGGMMDGMKVTAYFLGGTQQSVTWANTGSYVAGQAVGTGWSLYESGDTFGGNWILSNSTGQGISRLLIDAGPGNTVYDTTRIGDVGGTPGSERGWSFQVVSQPTGLDIVATYRDAVALTGFDPVGDLFRYLDIEFTSTGGFASGGQLKYITDTDNIKFAGDLGPVPEPTTLLVWSGLGAVGLAAAWRRRKRVA